MSERMLCYYCIEKTPYRNRGSNTAVSWLSGWRRTISLFDPSLFSIFSATTFVHTLLLALFHWFYFKNFSHYLSCGKSLQAEQDSVVCLNSLMGFMGFAVVLEHWFKASSICQFNKPEEREHINTLSLPQPLSGTCGLILSIANVIVNMFICFL